MIRKTPINTVGITDIQLPPNSRPLSVMLHASMMRGKVVYMFWLLPDGWDKMEHFIYRVSGFQTDQGVPPHVMPGNLIGSVRTDHTEVHYFLER